MDQRFIAAIDALHLSRRPKGFVQALTVGTVLYNSLLQMRKSLQGFQSSQTTLIQIEGYNGTGPKYGNGNPFNKTAQLEIITNDYNH